MAHVGGELRFHTRGAQGGVARPPQFLIAVLQPVHHAVEGALHLLHVGRSGQLGAGRYLARFGARHDPGQRLDGVRYAAQDQQQQRHQHGRGEHCHRRGGQHDVAGDVPQSRLADGNCHLSLVLRRRNRFAENGQILAGIADEYRRPKQPVGIVVVEHARALVGAPGFDGRRPQGADRALPQQGRSVRIEHCHADNVWKPKQVVGGCLGVVRGAVEQCQRGLCRVALRQQPALVEQIVACLVDRQHRNTGCRSQ